MARRLALLTLLALLPCAAALSRPHALSSELSDSDSLNPLSVWDDYEDSYETTPFPRIRTTTLSAKVLLKEKNPKVNVTMKNTKKNQSGQKKKVIKTTNINIASHTNFLVTKAPLLKPNLEPTGLSVVQIGDKYMVVETSDVETSDVEPVLKSTTKRPVTTRRTTRRPVSTHRPTTSTRRPTTSTLRLTTSTRRPPTTIRRPPSTTRRPTTRPVKRKTKTTKAPYTKKVTCPPKSPGWFSSFLEGNKFKKEPTKAPVVESGFLTKIYDWFMKSKSTWFEGGWFDDEEDLRRPVTTPAPVATTAASWFQNLLETEDNDGAYVLQDTTFKPTTKKALKKNYKGYQLIRGYPDVQWKVQEMMNLYEDAQGSGLMWWTMPTLQGSCDLLVPPDLLVDVKDHLKSNKIDYDVVIWDLQKAITYENPRLSKKQRLELELTRGHPMTWRRYHRYADIIRYLEYLQLSHTDLVELLPLGRSSEGLPLVAVKISLSSNDTRNKDSKVNKKWKLRSHMKPAVWVDGGAHAREWIAPAVATWIIHALVEGENGLGAEYDVLKQADFYIMPVMNPDGYEHSHTHDRLWRKTRSRSPDHSDDYYVGWFPWNWGQTECVGVDADRNWDFQWGKKGTSTDPCADNYAGPHAFSEPETRAVSKFLTDHRGQIKLYLSLHAYSQAWLVPGPAPGAPPDDGLLTEMGKLATVALADLYGTKYKVGTAAELRQPASGMAHDWAKARAGIKYSYHIDLRDSFGPYGFLLPGSQIVSTARETWQAIKVVVDNLNPG